jgi:hypothetical protein
VAAAPAAGAEAAAVAGGPAGAAVPAAPAAPRGWDSAERWVDLTDSPPARPAGNGNGDRWPAAPDGDGADWSGWWEPAIGDLDDGSPLSPLAARPPLSERVQPPNPDRVQAPPPPPSGAPEPDLSSGAPSPRTHSPHPAPGNPPYPAPSPLHPTPGTPHPAPATAGEAAPEGMLLARRVPQAHLAPELRRPGRAAPAAEPEGSLPDASEARAALSRYQASRQAARAVVDQGGAPPGGRDDDVGPGGPRPGNGGWS